MTRHERLEKWEDRRRTQLSVTNNLLLTFGIAICGYVIDKLITGEVPKNCLLVVGLYASAASVFFGTLMSVTRLLDYRYTVKKIRLEDKDLAEETDETKKAEIRQKMTCYKLVAQKLGTASWTMLWLQMGAILLSILLLSIFISRQA